MNNRQRTWWYLAALALCVGASRSGADSVDVLREMSDGVADVVERVMPSVVTVQTETIYTPYYMDWFRGRVQGRPETLEGQGSGVIIDAQGHVLTSRHVIKGADDITVVLGDGTPLEATLVGEDPHTDLAVLRINQANEYALTPVETGNSDKLRVGEFVIAVGSPFSLQRSVTLGIVSQKNRDIGILPYEDFIQTNADINPGNSGGPLIDVEGRMVGINAVIQTAGPKGSIGIGFAVPVNRAIAIARTLIAGKSVERPWLGIFPREMSVRAARHYFKQDGAVFVGEVFRDTPAYKGGIYKGDVLLEVDSEKVETILDLQRVVFDHDIGDTIPVTIMRGNRQKKMKIVLESMPDPKQFR